GIVQQPVDCTGDFANGSRIDEQTILVMVNDFGSARSSSKDGWTTPRHRFNSGQGERFDPRGEDRHTGRSECSGKFLAVDHSMKNNIQLGSLGKATLDAVSHHDSVFTSPILAVDVKLCLSVAILDLRPSL